MCQVNDLWIDMANVGVADLERTVRTVHGKISDGDELISQLRPLDALIGRKLSKKEIQALCRNGNSAEDWDSVVTTAKGRLNTGRIQNCRFAGAVSLGVFGSSLTIDGVSQSDGCFDSFLVNSRISDGALVRRNNLISHMWIATGAAVVGCGSVVSKNGAVFGNGNVISVGPESGGRDVGLYATMDLECCAAVACVRSDKSLLQEYADAVSTYCTRVQGSLGIVGACARVLGCPRIEDSVVGAHTHIEDSRIVNSTILGSDSDPTAVVGSSVARSIVQWGCEVQGLSIVEDSLMCEHSHVERHGKLVSSILGPNSGIAEGECTASLVGPFVGFHHQSLLIASLWPEGKGNVGYGANVGSNHTGKTNDQELWPGEGTFFGLTTAIKFPSNFVDSPYSMIATGVTTLPQKVNFPFSLINSTASRIAGVSPAFNEIFPGWILSNNMYTLIRNEHKFRTRNKATRTGFSMGSEIVRPDIVNKCLRAREVLLAAEGTATIMHEGQAVFTSREVKGLGKNYMTENSRTAGIRGYTQFIQEYALSGVLRYVLSNSVDGAQLNQSWERLPVPSTDSARWKHECSVLGREFPSADVATLLQLLVTTTAQTAKNVLKSKAKDAARGPAIIPDYKDVHPHPSQDKVVVLARTKADETKREVERILRDQASKL